MVFVVMIAMIVGSYVSLAFFYLSGKTYTDPSSFKTAPVPTNVMFFVALGFMVLAIIPSVWLILAKKKSASAPTVPLKQDEVKNDQAIGK